jgi:isopenicillin N synthase-like dioxygenase
MSDRLVIVQYDDLVAGKDLSSEVLEAFGAAGLGVIAIRGVPKLFEQYRRVLGQSHDLAHLDDESKALLEDEASMYNAGWSFGKEKLGNTPDTSKASFYFNPLHDQPGTAEQREKYPWALPPNRWPAKLPELEPACKELGATVHAATLLIAQQVDKLATAKVPEYPHEELGLLADTVAKTVKCKGRLLYYYPLTEQKEDGWIGWHNDSGFLTALPPDMFLDEKGEEMQNPDPNGGLWVVDRDSNPVKVDIPKDCLGVQCGECLQVITGGLLTATPHCVRPSMCKETKVARTSCPFFIDTDPAFPLRMPKGATREMIVAAAVSSKVPPLADRWTDDGMIFADFLGSTFKCYYEHAMKSAKTERGCTIL